MLMMTTVSMFTSNSGKFTELIASQVSQDEISENITIKERLTAQQQTLLWNEEKYLSNIPREANVPKGLLFDEHAEELFFQQFTWVILETSGKELELHQEL
ncbi:hypothetical protein TNIN_231461 [Trichonephila inaurata madagascariensis]|uniref:Uncharacterized protein n=1 Tax=Trichonephila inaurata madagascariensis TaxID=2747483 RepID=A0A8X6K2B7_9ARAC|nr:hypothetical protein TNIN_231461 [Trichonephila inaurata madagascariensis]